MPCTRPLKAYWDRDGGVVFSGRKADTPNPPLDLPCGKCPGCRDDQASAWMVRAVHQAQLSEENCFLTLTYDDRFLPENESLDKKDLQKFWKRLRKYLHGRRIAYLACGEYGEKHLRPHYHACVFGTRVCDDWVFRTKRKGRPVYVSKVLEKIWGKGRTEIEAFSPGAAQYIARYALKKEDDRPAVDRYWRLDKRTGKRVMVAPEFRTVSRRPGLGADWFDRFGNDVFPHDEVVINGRRYRPPRYYDNRLSEAESETIKERRRERMRARSMSERDALEQIAMSKRRIRPGQ